MIQWIKEASLSPNKSRTRQFQVTLILDDLIVTAMNRFPSGNKQQNNSYDFFKFLESELISTFYVSIIFSSLRTVKYTSLKKQNDTRLTVLVRASCRVYVFMGAFVVSTARAFLPPPERYKLDNESFFYCQWSQVLCENRMAEEGKKFVSWWERVRVVSCRQLLKNELVFVRTSH